MIKNELPESHLRGIKNTESRSQNNYITNDRLNGILKNDDIIINPVPVGLKSRCPEPQDPDLPGLSFIFIILQK